MAKPDQPKSDDADSGALRDLALEIKAHLKTAKGASETSLGEFKAIGELLLRAKKELPKGKYTSWTREKLGFSKQWSSRVVTLANNWADVQRARAWGKEQRIVNGSREYSVDGAIALLRRMERETSGKQKPPLNRPKNSPRAEMEAQLEALRLALADRDAELKKRVAEIESLKAQIWKQPSSPAQLSEVQ